MAKYSDTIYSMKKLDQRKTNQLAIEASNDIKEEIRRNEMFDNKKNTEVTNGPSSSSSYPSKSAKPGVAPKFLYKRHSFLNDEVLEDNGNAEQDGQEEKKKKKMKKKM